MIRYLGLIPVESRAESNCIKSNIIYKQRKERERKYKKEHGFSYGYCTVSTFSKYFNRTVTTLETLL